MIKTHCLISYKPSEINIIVVRNHVVLALGKIGHKEGIQAILDHTLEDKHPAVRHSSIRSLVYSEDKDKVIDPLIKRLRDPIPFVQTSSI